MEKVLDPEPLFALLVALVVWIFTEFTTSEEAIWLDPPCREKVIAKEIVELHQYKFRIILKEDDLFQFHDSNIFSKCGELLNRREIRELEFSDRKLDRQLGVFARSLEEFYSFICQHTTPELVAGRMMTGFKPSNIVSKEEYDRRLELSKNANRLANNAWNELEQLTYLIKRKMPRALD